LSFGAYLLGVVGLAALAVPLGLAAIRLRARLLPGWERAPARLAEAVIGLSLLTVELQLLGAVGLFEPAALIAASIAIAAAVLGLVEEPGGGDAAEAPPAPEVPTVQLLLALGIAVFLAAHWATGLQDVWARGMLTFDTLWYHGPFAARIAESGSVWGLHFTDPLYLNWFYPENSELLHAGGISMFGRDLFSPLVNFGWLGVALLAAWCIGRPYGVAPLSLVAVALALDIGPMVPREAGTTANDIAPAALLLAAAAVLINAAAGARAASGAARTLHSGGPPLRDLLPAGALLVAGLAMGLALGTKLTIAAAVAAMAIGIPFVIPSGMRRRALAIFLGGVAATAAFWFVRNLIQSGNPLPWARELGPIDLPGPNRGLEGRDNFTVAHYIFSSPDTDIWRQYFYEPVTNLLGPAWPLILGLSGAGAVLALIRPRTPVVRLLGAVTVVAAIAYLFTPLTAAGPEGQPLAFSINLRYLVPALALGLALLTLEPKLTPERFRLPLLVGGAATLLVTSLYSDSAYIWDEPFASKPWAVVIGLVLIGGPVGIALLGRRSVPAAALAAALLAVAVIGVGAERRGDYLASRYTHAEDFRFELDELAAFAKPTEDLRIGLAGTAGAYNQYLLYGDDLSNRVQFIGRDLPAGDFQAIDKCADFIEAAADGDYDYVVTTPSLDLNHPADAGASPERGWMLTQGAAAPEVLHRGRVSIFRIEGSLDPAACAASAAKTSGAGPRTITKKTP
jgi:hypothetical protein